MRQKKSHSKIRSWALIVIAIGIFGVYLFELMQIQIVDAEKYQSMVQGMTVSTQQIKAVRGEITDRNGVPLVENKMGYNIVFDRAFLPYAEENEIILMLVELFEQSNAKWIDNLPLSLDEPFLYIEGMESEVETLKSVKGAQPYTSAEDMIYWLIKEYKLEDYSKQDARKIIAVKYEMERKDFSNKTPYIFSSNVSDNMVVTVKESSFKLPGVEVATSAARAYPDDSFAPHILGLIGPLYKEEYEQLIQQNLIYDSSKEEYDTKGYTLDDTIGKSGIEKALENYLRGNNGLREIKIDARGNVVAEKESVVPVAGNTITITIDSEMQKSAAEYLEAQIKHLNETQDSGRGGEAHSGAVVVLKPDTGEVLAAATYPSYHLTEYREDYSKVANREGKPLINRAFMGEYTPGSIYKPTVALAGLNHNVITDVSTFNCTGRYYFYAPSYTPKCLSTHGHINVNNAIGLSCNIFFYETGRLVGIDAIDDMAKNLGLGEYTGIEVEESKGQRSNPEVKAARGGDEWRGADTIQTAIGQFDSKFTPIQLANYAATIANRGKRMELTLVKEIRDYSGKTIIVPFEPKIANVVNASSEAFEIIVKGMISATVGSAGGTFSGYPIEVASKTGTPQITEEKVNSTFIAFAPADKPELVVAVIIEEGWQGYTGAPVAKAIFDDYFKVDHRGAVASGPQRLEDFREARTQLGESSSEGIRDIDLIFPQFIDGIVEEKNEDNEEIQTINQQIA